MTEENQILNLQYNVYGPTYAMLAAGTQGVRGVGPYDLTVTPTHISGTVDGRLRTIVISKPDRIIRPMFRLDGVRWYAA